MQLNGRKVAWDGFGLGLKFRKGYIAVGLAGLWLWLWFLIHSKCLNSVVEILLS